jgi:transcriptional regulator with XRE-family HTH domain
VVSRKQDKPPEPGAAAAEAPNAQRKPRSKLAGVERHRVLSGEVKGPSVRLRVAKNVARIRAELKLTLAEMGERTGMNFAFISAIERGDQNLTLDSLSNLAVAYGVQPDHLLRDRDTFTDSAETPSLATLASITRAIEERLSRLPAESGDAPLERSVLASIASALYDALSGIERLRDIRRSDPALRKPERL